MILDDNDEYTTVRSLLHDPSRTVDICSVEWGGGYCSSDDECNGRGLCIENQCVCYSNWLCPYCSMGLNEDILIGATSATMSMEVANVSTTWIVEVACVWRGSVCATQDTYAATAPHSPPTSFRGKQPVHATTSTVESTECVKEDSASAILATREVAAV